MPLKINKNISLAYLGDAHKDDYLTFTQMSFKDLKELQAGGLQDVDEQQAVTKVLDVLSSRFVGGSVTDDTTGQKQEITKDELEELPVGVITHCIKQLSGGPDENL